MPRFNLSRKEANAIEETQPLVFYILHQLPDPEQEVLERLFLLDQEVADIAADEHFALPDEPPVDDAGDQVFSVSTDRPERERRVIRLREKALRSFAHHLREADHDADATKARYLLRANGFYERNRSYPPLTNEEKQAVKAAFDEKLDELFGATSVSLDVRANVEKETRLQKHGKKEKIKFGLIFLLSALNLRAAHKGQVRGALLDGGSPKTQVPLPTTQENATQFADAVFDLTEDDHYLRLELDTGEVLDISCEAKTPTPEDQTLLINSVRHPDAGHMKNYTVYLIPKDTGEAQTFHPDASGAARIPLLQIAEAVCAGGLEFRIQHRP